MSEKFKFEDKFEDGGTFGSFLMTADAMPHRFTNERKPDKPVIGGGELRKENLFLSKAFELGRKITPADEERIWAEIEAECD